VSELIVYSAIFGDFDSLRSPLGDFQGVRYVCFTDDPDLRCQPWEIRVQAKPRDSRRQARKIKLLFSESLPEAEVSLWHGGWLRLKSDPAELVERVLAEGDFGVFEHPYRSNVYREAEECLRLKKAPREDIERQMRKYRQERFPGTELSACYVLIRRHTEDVEKFCKRWWRELCEGSLRDQLSFDYVRWKLKFPVVRLPADEADKYFEFFRHRRRR